MMTYAIQRDSRVRKFLLEVARVNTNLLERLADGLR